MTDPEKIDNPVARSTVSPAVLIRSYADKEWEIFIQEWVSSLEAQYVKVENLGGSGDKGRDVIAFLGPPALADSEWDSYQCKHYKKPVQPSDIWVEIGKLCYYTWRGDYKKPRKYWIVAPHEVAPSLKELLKKPADILEGLKKNWEKHCEVNKITSEEDVKLEGALLEHVEAFDFSILGYSTLIEILKQHSTTPFWDIRFKAEIPDRPADEPPPLEPTEKEARYIAQLLQAYADEKGCPTLSIGEIEQHPNYLRHYQRSREDFYKAECLYRFTKEITRPGSFEAFKAQIFDGVVDVYEGQFSNAFEKLKATTQQAVSVETASDLIGKMAKPGDKKGVCHHLANEDRFRWKS